MKQMYSQFGWTTFGAIGVMTAAAIGFFSFEGLLNLIPGDNKMTVPWVLVTLFLLPLASCIQLLLKLWELREQDDLSREERRRLKPLIEGKTKQFFIAIVYYVLSAVIVVTFFFFSENNAELFRTVIKIAGGLLGISIFSMFLMISEMNEISDFKANLKERLASKKRQKAALKRLSSKE